VICHIPILAARPPCGKGFQYPTHPKTNRPPSASRDAHTRGAAWRYPPPSPLLEIGKMTSDPPMRTKGRMVKRPRTPWPWWARSPTRASTPSTAVGLRSRISRTCDGRRDRVAKATLQPPTPCWRASGAGPVPLNPEAANLSNLGCLHYLGGKMRRTKKDESTQPFPNNRAGSRQRAVQISVACWDP